MEPENGGMQILSPPLLQKIGDDTTFPYSIGPILQTCHPPLKGFVLKILVSQPMTETIEKDQVEAKRRNQESLPQSLASPFSTLIPCYVVGVLVLSFLSLSTLSGRR